MPCGEYIERSGQPCGGTGEWAPEMRQEASQARSEQGTFQTARQQDKVLRQEGVWIMSALVRKGAIVFVRFSN